MTRAVVAILQGDFMHAFSYHPFSFIFAGGWFFFFALVFFPTEKRYLISLKLEKIERKSGIIFLLFIFFSTFGFVLREP